MFTTGGEESINICIVPGHRNDESGVDATVEIARDAQEFDGC